MTVRTQSVFDITCRILTYYALTNLSYHFIISYLSYVFAASKLLLLQIMQIRHTGYVF
jgi:hypothetical protein